MVRGLGKRFELCTYDTLPLARDLFRTSRKLSELASVLGIDAGRSHRALDDARTLAGVFLALGEMQGAARAQDGAREPARLRRPWRSRSGPSELCDEALLFRDFCVPLRVRPVQLAAWRCTSASAAPTRSLPTLTT